MRAVSQARGALNALAALLPDTAERVKGADTESVPLSELRVGDIVLVRPGARVPADGTVVEGTANVDESMITGESKTVPKGIGAKLIAGTVASRGSVRVKITAVGDQTALSGIMRLVATAQASGSRTQALADRTAAILFYVAVAAGAITFIYCSISGDKEHAMIRTATVLIIACPHALVSVNGVASGLSALRKLSRIGVVGILRIHGNCAQSSCDSLGGHLKT
jgi:Cu2+-exporting ATPase